METERFLQVQAISDAAQWKLDKFHLFSIIEGKMRRKNNRKAHKECTEIIWQFNNKFTFLVEKVEKSARIGKRRRMSEAVRIAKNRFV